MVAKRRGALVGAVAACVTVSALAACATGSPSAQDKDAAAAQQQFGGSAKNHSLSGCWTDSTDDDTADYTTSMVIDNQISTQQGVDPKTRKPYPPVFLGQTGKKAFYDGHDEKYTNEGRHGCRSVPLVIRPGADDAYDWDNNKWVGPTWFGQTTDNYGAFETSHGYVDWKCAGDKRTGDFQYSACADAAMANIYGNNKWARDDEGWIVDSNCNQWGSPLVGCYTKQWDDQEWERGSFSIRNIYYAYPVLVTVKSNVKTDKTNSEDDPFVNWKVDAADITGAWRNNASPEGSTFGGESNGAREDATYMTGWMTANVHERDGRRGVHIVLKGANPDDEWGNPKASRPEIEISGEYKLFDSVNNGSCRINDQSNSNKGENNACQNGQGPGVTELADPETKKPIQPQCVIRVPSARTYKCSAGKIQPWGSGRLGLGRQFTVAITP